MMDERLMKECFFFFLHTYRKRLGTSVVICGGLMFPLKMYSVMRFRHGLAVALSDGAKWLSVQIPLQTQKYQY